jgi:hypothetical protein
MDRRFTDPYKRQRQKSVGVGDGSGNKLTTPGDEADMGGSGFGSRFRGPNAPRNYSESEEDDTKPDIPSSHDDFINNPPRKEDLGNWFTDPEDPLSVFNRMNERMANPDRSLEGELAGSRIVDKSNSLKQDDSLFNRLSKRLKGVRR